MGVAAVPCRTALPRRLDNTREIAPLVLTGPPSVTGFAGGRPRPSEVIAYWPALIPKRVVTPEVIVASVGEVVA